MKTLAIAAFLLASCGYPSGEKSKREPAPAPAPTPPPTTDKGDWPEIKPLVDEQCALSGCHAGASFLATAEAMKASSSLRRIQSGNMPLKTSPNYSLYNSSKRRKFIDYLSD